MAAKTLFEKVWNEHVVDQEAGQPALLYIDLHLVHEVTSPQAFEGLRDDRTQAARAPSHLRDPGPQRSDHRPQPAHRGSGIGPPGRGLAQKLQRVRRQAVRSRGQGTGHRPRDWTRTGTDPARDDDRMRRQPHLHARRVRRARVRYRHQRGRARAGDAMPMAGAAAHDGNPGRRQAGAGRDRQGHDPGDDRAGSAPTAPPDTWSSIAARRSRRFRSKSG